MRRMLIVVGWMVLYWGAAPLDGGEQEQDVRRLQERIAEFKRAEAPDWTKIPWTATLLDAMRQSKQEGAPIFLFSHEGNLSIGRC